MVKQGIPDWPQMQRGSAQRGKQGWSAQQERHNGARARKHEMRKVKAQLELNLAMDVMGNKKAFCKWISSRRKTKENPGLGLVLPLMPKAREKAEALSVVFASVSPGKSCPQASQVPEPTSESGEHGCSEGL